MATGLDRRCAAVGAASPTGSSPGAARSGSGRCNGGGQAVHTREQGLGPAAPPAPPGTGFGGGGALGPSTGTGHAGQLPPQPPKHPFGDLEKYFHACDIVTNDTLHVELSGFEERYNCDLGIVEQPDFEAPEHSWYEFWEASPLKYQGSTFSGKLEYPCPGMWSRRLQSPPYYTQHGTPMCRAWVTEFIMDTKYSDTYVYIGSWFARPGVTDFEKLAAGISGHVPTQQEGVMAEKCSLPRVYRKVWVRWRDYVDPKIVHNTLVHEGWHDYIWSTVYRECVPFPDGKSDAFAFVPPPRVGDVVVHRGPSLGIVIEAPHFFARVQSIRIATLGARRVAAGGQHWFIHDAPPVVNFLGSNHKDIRPETLVWGNAFGNGVVPPELWAQG